MKSARIQQKKGFTLVEIIVSLGLFAVVAVIAIGAYLRIIDANKQAQALKTAVNNANFALESISRELRVGSNYHCYNAASTLTFSGTLPASTAGDACPLGTYTYDVAASPNSGPGIAFNSSIIDSSGPCNLVHAFQFNPTTKVIEKAEQPGCGQALSAFVPVVSSDFNVDHFDMQVVTGPAISPAPQLQPKVFIYMLGYTGPSLKDQSSFSVQTTATERLMTETGQ